MLALVPAIFYRLDDEAECRADAIHVFVHNLLYDGRLSGIVQSPMQSAFATANKSKSTHSIKIRISLSFKRAFRSMDSILDRVLSDVVVLYVSTC
jgi:hypothetical protein